MDFIDPTPRVAIPKKLTEALACARITKASRLEGMLKSVVSTYFEAQENSSNSSDPLVAEVKRLDLLLQDRERNAAITFKRIDSELARLEKEAGVTLSPLPEVAPPQKPSSRQKNPMVFSRPVSRTVAADEPDNSEEFAILQVLDEKLQEIAPERKFVAVGRSVKEIDADLASLCVPLPLMPAPFVPTELEPPTQILELENFDSNIDQIADLLSTAESALKEAQEVNN